PGVAEGSLRSDDSISCGGRGSGALEIFPTPYFSSNGDCFLGEDGISPA
ncbi:unnamed protein product, partial [marine sediment metagenome]